MAAWLIIIALSAIVGICCAWLLSGRLGLVCSGAVPWIGVLAWFVFLAQRPYGGGGASMWLVAQFFAGTVAAVVGIAAYSAANKLFRGMV